MFNFATAAFYWDDLEPEPGQLRFAEGSPYIWRRSPPDRVVAFGKKHGQTLKGRPLLWHNRARNPSWMLRDPEELRQRYWQRFREIAARYAENIPIWDGVNESLVCSNDFPPFSGNDRTHQPYVPWAFTEEQKLFRPENLLIINDVTSFNWPANETTRFYQQCRQLLNDGIGIEGIGFQFHFFNRESLDAYLNSDQCDPRTLLDTYEQFATLGLPLWITEITIGSAGDDGLSVQARVVRDIYRLWFAAPKMAGITWWNLGDGTAYGNEGVAGGGLTDDDFNPKPAYQALDELINRNWKTYFDATSDATGRVRFRGFHSGYQITVTTANKTNTFEMSVRPLGRTGESNAGNPVTCPNAIEFTKVNIMSTAAWASRPVNTCIRRGGPCVQRVQVWPRSIRPAGNTRNRHLSCEPWLADETMIRRGTTGSSVPGCGGLHRP